MFYRIFFLWIIISLACPPARADEAVRYRVELLVLRHLDASAAARVVPGLRDFSAALDLQQPEEPGAETAGDDRAQPQAGAPAEGDSAPGATTAIPRPPPVAWIEEPGDTMQEAWRRLRLSAGFRPELYFSWEQADAEPFPLVRVHDDQLLYPDDSRAGQRAEVGAGGGEVPTTASDVKAALAEQPDPARFYRIDGTARLRRSRFLHLELDLEWREAAVGLGAGLAAPEPAAADPSAPPRPGPFQMHRIRQSRQVGTQQIEYFDGAFFGVLAAITRIGSDAEPPAADGSTP